MELTLLIMNCCLLTYIIVKPPICSMIENRRRRKADEYANTFFDKKPLPYGPGSKAAEEYFFSAKAKAQPND